jgi:pimeloyl-ACP methyl ester carboxylesterase
MTVAGPEFSVADLPGFWRGFRFSMETLGQEASRLDLNELVPALEMPVFFFLGRRDHWVPPETSEAYVAALQAPRKTLVWFEESGHEPFMDEAEKFNGSMVELVRPAALEAQRGGARAPSAPEPTRAAS